MNKVFICSVIVISQIALLAGCAHTDVVLRPERTTFIPVRAEMPIVKIYGTDELRLRCLDWKGKTDGGSEAADQCLYYSTDEQEIFGKFSALSNTDELRKNIKIKRNIYTSFLVNLSDQNCSTFLGRAFANKSSFDTGRNIMQDVLTGSTAAAASASPPAAAGMSLANLVIGKSVDNINSTFYFEKTFQSLSAAIGWQRELVLAEIETMKTKSYDERPIYDILAAVRKYDDACSIRVGLAKLQELAQEARQNKNEHEKAKADLAKNKKENDETNAALAKKSDDMIDDKLTIARLSGQVAGLYKQLEEATFSTSTNPASGAKLPAVLASKTTTQNPVEKMLGASSSDFKAKRTEAEAISNKANSQVKEIIDLKAAPTR